MAQKQFGIIPHDTSQVGFGQDTPVVDHEAMKKRMVKKIEKHLEKIALCVEPDYGESNHNRMKTKGVKG